MEKMMQGGLSASHLKIRNKELWWNIHAWNQRSDK